MKVGVLSVEYKSTSEHSLDLIRGLGWADTIYAHRRGVTRPGPLYIKGRTTARAAAARRTLGAAAAAILPQHSAMPSVALLGQGNKTARLIASR